MSYDIRQFARLGLLHELIAGIDADAPSAGQIAKVKARLAAAIADIRVDPGDLTSRLNNAEAKVHRPHRSRSGVDWPSNGTRRYARNPRSNNVPGVLAEGVEVSKH